MKLRGFAAGVAASLLAAAGCGGESAESGVTAYLRVANAQFVPGTMPAASSGDEPALRGVSLLNTNVYPGQENFPLTGAVEDGGSLLVGLQGDAGYWVVPAPLLDPASPDNYDFSTQLTFSPLLPMGAQHLLLRGVGSEGKLGPGQDYTLAVNPPAPPDGALVVTLVWDTESDMDLHVVVPDPEDPTKTLEIWSKTPVGLPPQTLGSTPPTPDQIAAAGYLDFDSNANCVIDGRREENVIFQSMPASGTYTVRVDAFSLCGQPDAQWYVSTVLNGQIYAGQWEATDADTRGPHGAGAGRLAFAFTIP